MASIRSAIGAAMVDLSHASAAWMLPRGIVQPEHYGRRCDSGSAAPDFTSPSEKLVWMSLM